MSNLSTVISGLLAEARDAGATPEQMKNLRAGFRLQFGWNPTKHVPSDEERRAHRKRQKAARRANRGRHKGQSNRKGQRFSVAS